MPSSLTQTDPCLAQTLELSLTPAKRKPPRHQLDLRHKPPPKTLDPISSSPSAATPAQPQPPTTHPPQKGAPDSGSGMPSSTAAPVRWSNSLVIVPVSAALRPVPPSSPPPPPWTSLTGDLHLGLGLRLSGPALSPAPAPVAPGLLRLYCAWRSMKVSAWRGGRGRGAGGGAWACVGLGSWIG